MILISVAHSSKARGAENADVHINEYDVSSHASETCFMSLKANGIQCVLMDIGYLDDHAYSVQKLNAINALNPDACLEIHCNGSIDKAAKYGEVLYHYNSIPSKKLAENVMATLAFGFMKSASPLPFINKGAQPNSDKQPLFFLDKVKCPSIIVEGLFITNDAHAKWLKDGGDLAYGTLVGEGLVQWFKERNN